MDHSQPNASAEQPDHKWQGQRRIHLTVATIVTDGDRFLLVEESPFGTQLLNQPAGHVEPGEQIIAAAVRETLEETGYLVQLSHFLGHYHYYPEAIPASYHRFCFIADQFQRIDDAVIDSDIDRPVWLSYPEILARREQLRSQLVLDCIDDYLAGVRHPLSQFDRQR
ncbi:NUDIX hydrolase [Gammaproteobacteria bacterium LSUCC0057]|uniref:Phosphatase NudJ n=1 Tax=Gammaproteobacteria bacterium LSUCC0057 TaxID=2559237 RepID=A0A4Y8UJM0_9GAMM|nr:NUDIX hydrolase [Gammaproteobacteria bacterium LSUCC0057]